MRLRQRQHPGWGCDEAGFARPVSPPCRPAPRSKSRIRRCTPPIAKTVPKRRDTFQHIVRILFKRARVIRGGRDCCPESEKVSHESVPSAPRSETAGHPARAPCLGVAEAIARAPSSMKDLKKGAPGRAPFVIAGTGPTSTTTSSWSAPGRPPSGAPGRHHWPDRAGRTPPRDGPPVVRRRPGAPPSCL